MEICERAQLEQIAEEDAAEAHCRELATLPETYFPRGRLPADFDRNCRWLDYE